MSRTYLEYSLQLDWQHRLRSSWQLSHASGVLMRRSYSHTLHGFVVLAVSVTSGILSSQSFHIPCVGSLSSRYPSLLACSRRCLLTRLAWACCSRSIYHAWRALVVVFSHALCVFVVRIGVGGRSAGSRVERGSSVERDNIQFNYDQMCFGTTGLMYSSSPVYHPHGAPIFPSTAESKRKTKTQRKLNKGTCKEAQPYR